MFAVALFLCCLFSNGLHAGDDIAKAFDVPRDRFHIYLLIGQSNMAGRASYTEEESAVIKRCYLLDTAGVWDPARNPLNRYSTIRKDLGIQKLNPGYTFAKTMLEQDTSISIGLVVNAKGGTKIKQWGKGTHFYQEAVRRTKAAQKSGILKGILWHQGESDYRDPANYLEDLKALVISMRKDLGKPNLPFVAGQVFYHPEIMPDTEHLNERIAGLPGAVPFTGCASSEGVTTRDGAHFDAKGAKLLGRKYAEEMQKIQAKENAKKNEPGRCPD